MTNLIVKDIFRTVQGEGFHTGSPALFLHAADAIHGDLGMIQPNDAVICLSKSGETSEIRVLIPLLKSFGNPLIAMTANRNSTLARQADFLLWTPVDQEADPNNLAPTTSTISHIVPPVIVAEECQQNFAFIRGNGGVATQGADVVCVPLKFAYGNVFQFHRFSQLFAVR